jgi:hypothetical protein
VRYSLETVYKVCNDDTGEVIEVGPDADGLDLTEIRFRESAAPFKVTDRIVFSQEALPLVIEALQRCLAASQKA